MLKNSPIRLNICENMDDFSLPFSSSLSCDFSSGSPSVSGSYSGDCLFQADENEILAHEIGY